MARVNQVRRMGTSRRGGGYKARSRTSTRSRAVVRKNAQRQRVLNRGSLITKTNFGFPDILETTLVYADHILLSSSAGNLLPNKYYNMNGLYDPDPALGGGQPYWFDQLSAVYSRYAVIGSKITVDFTHSNPTLDTGDVGPWVVGVIGDSNTTLTATSAGPLIASQNTDTQTLGGDYKTVRCTATYSPMQSLGRDWTDSTVAGTPSANPSQNWYAGLFAAPQGVAVNTVVHATVRIEYRVRFSAIIDNAGS